jgi:hypothetical protein
LAGGDVEHVQDGLLIATVRDLEGQPGSIGGGLPAVERGTAGRVELLRIHEGRVIGVQDRMFLAG